jgi:hypothetical protein
MSDGTINFPARTSVPSSPAVDRFKIWVNSDGKPKITNSNGVTNGFEQFYGSDVSVGTEDGFLSNNTTTPAEYINVPYTVASIDSSSKYEVSCTFVWSYSSAANDYEGAVFINGSKFSEDFKVEPKDNGTNQRIWSEVKFLITGAELATLTGNISFKFQASVDGNTARTYYCYIKMMRVL